MKTVIWTKNDCFYCHMAKQLLEMKGMEFEERNIESNEWSRGDMLDEVPFAETVPQIFHDENYVGGFTELQDYLREVN